MRRYLAVLLTFVLTLNISCQEKVSSSVPDFYATPTPVPSGARATESPAATVEPAPEYVVSGLPVCEGRKKLDSPIKFSWPNLETALEKLEGYNWGYYSCSSSQPELAAFMKDRMVKPPFNWEQTNWIDNEGATLAVYYHSVYRSWVYIWMLPGPDRAGSNLVISKSDPGDAHGWDCWFLPSLPLMERRASAQLPVVWPVAVNEGDL